jgi:hypothetical protein
MQSAAKYSAIIEYVGRNLMHGVPPQKCSARSQQSGERCGNWAIPGSPAGVCRWHGARESTKSRAEVEVTIDQVRWASPDDRRPIGEIMREAVHIQDCLMRDAARPYYEGQPLTLDERNRLSDRAKVALHMAKVTVDAGVEVALVREFERNAELEGQLIARAIGAVVHGLTDTLGSGHAVDLNVWALNVAHDALVAAEASPDGDWESPSVPPLPFGLAVVEPGPGRKVEPAALPSRPLVDASDDELEEEILRRLKERGEVA